MATEGVFPKTDGDILYASEANHFNASTWYKITYDNTPINAGLIRWSATKFQTENGDSSDSGATWTVGGYNILGSDTIADTDGSTNGCAADGGAANTTITSDSGDTWTASTTSPSAGAMTKINAISMFGSVVVVGGDAGANESIYYSSDSGDTFTEATTGPTNEVDAIVMASATIGYAREVTGDNIWKTTDGGVNWTDTTDSSGLGTGGGARFFAIDTDTLLMMQTDRLFLRHYVNSTNTITEIYQTGLTANKSNVSNIVKATNGDYYWVHYMGGTGTNIGISILYMYRWDGTNIYVKSIGEATNTTESNTFTGNTTASKPVLIEGAANVLYLNGQGRIFEIGVPGD